MNFDEEDIDEDINDYYPVSNYQGQYLSHPELYENAIKKNEKSHGKEDQLKRTTPNRLSTLLFMDEDLTNLTDTSSNMNINGHQNSDKNDTNNNNSDLFTRESTSILEENKKQMLSLSSTSTVSTSSADSTNAVTANTYPAKTMSPLSPNRFVYIQFPLNTTMPLKNEPLSDDSEKENKNYQKSVSFAYTRQQHHHQEQQPHPVTTFDKDIYMTKLLQRQSQQLTNQQEKQNKILNRFHSFRLDDKLSSIATHGNNNLIDNANLSKSYLDLTKADEEEDEEEVVANHEKRSKCPIQLQNERKSNSNNLRLELLNLDRLNLKRVDNFKLKNRNIKEEENDREEVEIKSESQFVNNQFIPIESFESASNKQTNFTAISSMSSSSSSSTPSSPYLGSSKKNTVINTPKSTRHAANIVLSSLKKSIRRSGVSTAKKQSLQKDSSNEENFDDENQNKLGDIMSSNNVLFRDNEFFNLPNIKLELNENAKAAVTYNLDLDCNKNAAINKRERHDSGVGGSLTRELR